MDSIRILSSCVVVWHSLLLPMSLRVTSLHKGNLRFRQYLNTSEATMKWVNGSYDLSKKVIKLELSKAEQTLKRQCRHLEEIIVTGCI